MGAVTVGQGAEIERIQPPPATNSARKRAFAALRYRNFRLYFVSQVISFSGTWMQSIAMSWLVLELTGSGTALGAVLAMQFVPMLLLGPTGGVIADRVDVRRLLITTQSAAAVLALVLGLLTVTGTVELWMVYVLAACLGSVTALDNPARQTFVLEMVGREDLANAVTLQSVVVNSARALGPAIAGVLIVTLGVGQCFIANAVSYVAVIAALCSMRPDELLQSPRVPRARGQLRAGVSHVRHDPTLRTVLAMALVVGMFTMEFNVSLPLLADRTFHSGSTGLAIMTALMGVGGCVGGLVIAARGESTPRRLILMAGMFGVSMTALAIAPTAAFAYLVIPVVGAAMIGTLTSTNVLLQLNALPEMRGRVMALFSVAVIGSTPIGGPVIGWVGDQFGGRASIIVGAVAAILAAVYGARRLPIAANGAVAPDLRAVVS